VFGFQDKGAIVMMTAIWLQVKTTDFASRVCEDKVSEKRWCPFSHHVFCCITYSSNWYKPALLYFSHVLNPRYNQQRVLTGWDFKILTKSHYRTRITIQMTCPLSENMVFSAMRLIKKSVKMDLWISIVLC